MAAAAPRQTNRVNRVLARRLLYIPIVHTQADMGALRHSIARAARMKLGQRGWQRRVRAVEQIWMEIERVIRGLKLPYGQVRLYQDGLPVCGREEALVAELARAGSRNHQILLDLMARGATLMGTEAWELLKEEYQLAQESLASQSGAGSPAPPAARSAPAGESILEQRDRFIARRINETLKEGETGILFLGMLHSVERHLSQDIQVIYPCHRH
jgi:hypothetical protein